MRACAGGTCVLLAYAGMKVLCNSKRRSHTRGKAVASSLVAAELKRTTGTGKVSTGVGEGRMG